MSAEASGWKFSYTWQERRGDRLCPYGREARFGNRRDAERAWHRAQRYDWTHPAMVAPEVSPLYRVDFEVIDGARSRTLRAVIVREMPSDTRRTPQEARS